MPVTMQQVMAYLNADEPRYAQAATLGEEALSHLLLLVDSADSGLAAKAVFLAGLIRSRRSVEVVRRALAHADPVVRVAGASALPYLPLDEATPLFVKSLEDEDAGVLRLVLDALPHRPSDVLFEAVEHFVRDGNEPDQRMRAAEILAGWRRSQSR